MLLKANATPELCFKSPLAALTMMSAMKFSISPTTNMILLASLVVPLQTSLDVLSTSFVTALVLIVYSMQAGTVFSIPLIAKSASLDSKN